jgi:hypothetical protein
MTQNENSHLNLVQGLSEKMKRLLSTGIGRPHAIGEGHIGGNGHGDHGDDYEDYYSDYGDDYGDYGDDY